MRMPIYTENKTYLTQLDTGHRRCRSRKQYASGVQKSGRTAGFIWLTKTSEALLKAVAMTLISTVGGASGPLYGTFFLQAAGKASGLNELNAAQMADVLEGRHRGQ